MIRNSQKLVISSPIMHMETRKKRFAGVSHGLSEAGYDIRIAQTMWLHPLRKFRLASSIEYFRMPDDLVGVVHDKSTWARRKLSVFNTVIEPGWCGWLTLELVYHGWTPLKLEKGMGIAQVLFSEIESPSTYMGKYQYASDKPQEAIFEKA